MQVIALVLMCLRLTGIGIGIGPQFGGFGGSLTPPSGTTDEWITPFIWMNDYV